MNSVDSSKSVTENGNDSILEANRQDADSLNKLFQDSEQPIGNVSGLGDNQPSTQQPKLIAMMRLKNEGEWILQTLEKASLLVDGFVILDDGSTDSTRAICRSFPKVIRYEYQDEAVTDEARDKERLLQWTLDENPDWILALDGDELLEDAAPLIIRKALASSPPSVSMFAFNFLYMWDTHDRYRVDGKYSNLRHPRLFRITGLKIDPRMLRFARTGNGANFHCGSVPYNLPGQLYYLDLNVKHYGYFNKCQREQKMAFYTQLDPVNAAAGCYNHLTGEEGMILLPWRERDPGEAAPASPAPYAFPGSPGTQGSYTLTATVTTDGSIPLVAILYRHSPMTVGRMFKSALMQMGANLISIGGFVGNRVGWPIDRTYDDYIDLPDIIVDLADFYKASQIVGLVERRCGRRPAMILQIDGDNHVCNDLGYKDIHFITIATDPHLKSPTYGHAAQCSTAFYCMQSGYMGLYGDKTRYVAYGYDPEIHFVEPNTEKKYDVSCIGYQFPQRVEMGMRLQEIGFNVRFENGPILDEYRRILNESWISFNISAADDTNMRVFESLACGTLLVSNVTTDMGRFFTEGSDYVSYRTLGEAVEKIAYYLNNKDELAVIADSGRKAVQGHSYANRLKQIFRETGGDFNFVYTGLEIIRAEAPCAIRALDELPPYYRHVRPEILATVPNEAMKILDVGCGAGLLGKALKEQNRKRRVVGIEMDREAIHYARINMDEAFHDDLESFSPPFQKDQFDCIIFADVLEHLKNPWGIARLYASFLKPGGTFVASIPNVRFLPFLFNLTEKGSWKYQDEGILDNTHLRFFTRREFLKILDYAGVRCNSITYLGTGSCAHLHPAHPERAIRCGNIAISNISEVDFAEMSAFQILFTGAYCPVEKSRMSRIPFVDRAGNDFASFARFCGYVDTLYDNASLLIGANRFDDAIPVLELLLRFSPNHDLAHNDLGLLYFDKGELKPAVEQFTHCVRLAPGNADALKNLASLYVEMGDLGKGIEAYREIVTLDPRNSEALVNLGNLNNLAGSKETALSLYAQALAIDPNNSAASRGLSALGQ